MATNIANIPPSTGGGGGGGAATLPSTLILADASTTQAPNVLVLRHTTSATAATGVPGFGATFAVELQSASGSVVQAMTDVTTWTVATGGSEVASRKISLLNGGGGSMAEVLRMNPNSAGSLTFGAATATVSDTGTLAVLALASAGVQIGAIRGRQSAVGMEFISNVGEFIFYTGAMTASNVMFKVNATGLGFAGTAPIAKPTITGSKTANAALASLLTALASYGLITDSST